MTVEEIEIIVTAKVEEALKEFQKIVPTIKQSMKQAQEAFSKVDTKAMTNKLNQSIQFVKKKIQDLKKSSKNNEIAIKVNNKDAQKQISQVQKQIDSLQEKINARQMKLNVINPQIDKIVDDTRRNVTPEGISPNDKSMDNVVNNALSSNKDFTSLNNQAQKLYIELEMYNKQLNEAKAKIIELEQETSRTATTQSKLSSFFSTFKTKVEQVKPSISSLRNNFKDLPKITQNITNNIKGMGKGVKQGLGHVLKYAAALFSLRSIYSVLSNSASSWMSSQNAGAQQLSANIEYLKYSMGSVFAPVIEYVIGLVYQLMKVIQSLVYAFSGINIFAKATASSMNKAAGSANKASKSLSGVHSEINNASDNNSSGSGTTAPSMDLSQMDTQMSSFSQKLYNFFKPLVDSWNTYGNGLIEQIKITASQAGELISSVWGSFENIITNGTLYSVLENIFAIIGNISEAFKNAWNNDGNGDKIVQNLANAFNNLLGIIEKITQSTVFQWILDTGVLAIEKLTKAVEWVTQKVEEFVGFLTGSESDLDGWAILVGAIVSAILLLVAAIGAYNIIVAIMGVVTTIATSPITLIVLAIAALIAIIVLCVKHWDTIKETISNVVKIIKDKVSTAFNNIKNTISNIMTTVKNTISNVWNGIWNIIKNIVNKVLGGIENFVNGIIKGINVLLSGISKVANAVGSLIGLNPINLQLSTISLPRLAKGGVLTEATAVIAGEYSGAKSNPEIVTPQSIMEETFDRVMSRHEGNNDDKPINLAVYVGNTKLGQILLDDLRNMKRRSGKDIEALVGG